MHKIFNDIVILTNRLFSDRNFEKYILILFANKKFLLDVYWKENNLNAAIEMLNTFISEFFSFESYLSEEIYDMIKQKIIFWESELNSEGYKLSDSSHIRLHLDL
jgi:hypothetical protein